MSDVLSPINVFGIGEVRTHTAVLAVDMDVPARDWWRRCGEGTPRGQGQNTDRGQSPRGRQAFATNHHFEPSHTEPLDDRSQISLTLPLGDYIGCRSSAASRVRPGPTTPNLLPAGGLGKRWSPTTALPRVPSRSENQTPTRRRPPAYSTGRGTVIRRCVADVAPQAACGLRRTSAFVCWSRASKGRPATTRPGRRGRCRNHEQSRWPEDTSRHGLITTSTKPEGTWPRTCSSSARPPIWWESANTWTRPEASLNSQSR